jgi:thiamine kinase-like enzyme
LNRPNTPPLSPWYGPQRQQWLESVRAWLASGNTGQTLGTFKTMHILRERPWSLIARVVHERGNAYFKACAAGGLHEAALLNFLHEQALPGLAQIHAYDAKQAWIVLADAGRPVRDICGQRGMRAALTQVLGSYAQLQIRLLSHTQSLQALGLPCRPIEQLPDLLEDLLQNGAHAAGRSAQAADALARDVRQQYGFLRDVCAQLAGSAYAYALDHGDLHTGNILTRRGALALVDWGDACLTHPFTTAFTALQFSAQSITPAARPAALAQWRAAYLAPWQAFAPRYTLEQDFARALWLGRVLRALDYANMFAGADAATLAHWRPLIGQALQRWIDARAVLQNSSADDLLALLQDGMDAPPPLRVRVKNALRGAYVRVIKGE